MTTDITKLNLKPYIPQNEPEKGLKNTTSQEDEKYFLSVTSRFAPKDSALLIVEKVDSSEVFNGNVENEIAKLQNEENEIKKLVSANSAKSLNSIKSENTLNAALKATKNPPKKITFIEYQDNTPKINSKTNTTNIMQNIQYSNEDEKNIVEGSINLLVEWLDNYINNYDEKVAEGKKKGESELKLSMLLEIRKAIENADFPIGFGDYSAPEDANTLGSYAFNIGGYDNFYHLNTNRSILLNPKFLMPQRAYNSYTEILQAANADPNISFSYIDIVCATDEGYYNYCTNYMASVLVHELTHSLHIYNEAVTYYVNDCFDDDYSNQPVKGVDQAFLDQYFGFNGQQIIYGDLGIANNINNFEEAVAHGHKNNLAYEELYVNKGFTMEDDRNELLNFVYYV